MTEAAGRPPLVDARRGVLLLALALTAIRLAAAGAIHLTEDEAYYRFWAQHLQLGYLDHPPMIGWWIRAGMSLFGDTPLGVRLLPTLSCGLNTWLIGDLAVRLGAGPRAAFRAALWYNATLTVCLGGMLAIPDAPASLFWTITLWALARFWEHRRAGWWLAAGLAAGLAVMSKYSGLFLAPGVLVWLLATPGGAAELKKPGPWAAAVLAAAVFALNIVWNAQHQWITFIKQFGRVAPHGFTLAYLFELVVTQILLFTPIMAAYAALGARQAWRERGQAGAVQLLLPAATSAPFAAYLLLHSLHDRVQGHWPAPAFGAMAICAAVAAERFAATPWQAWLRRLAPVGGYAIAAATFAAMALPTPSPLGRLDPTLPLRGWPQFAGDIDTLRARTGAAWVGTLSYGVYSQLQDEHRISGPLLELVERDRYWSTDPGRPDFTHTGLVVDLSRRMKVPDVRRCFTEVTPAGELRRAGGPAQNQRYTAFLVSGPRRDVWIQGCPWQISPGVWR
ncbi:MAG TPA: glycosyltransferase family 39 protein [Phenylobacterium sp.]|uniref:ArnT family glycosyltransferase n=1 Tax=Phenylobacterium sp. TaxID=1871053 RepID=UPI002BB9ECBA|nr:glycosyltransferase family 39 protein [Phenylobacterium sp.]HXA38117.1 glycosyltransferase family 39 protein [Phenylobacterium sp.]